MIVADVNRGPSRSGRLNQLLAHARSVANDVEADIARGTQELQRIVAAADGLQKNGLLLWAMRAISAMSSSTSCGAASSLRLHGGLADLSLCPPGQRKVAGRRPVFCKLKRGVQHRGLLNWLGIRRDRQFRTPLPGNICRSLSAGAHGDPSRPWNRFSIATRDADGTRILNYEGNWRDIFQNWEALAVSFPGFTAGMVCKFVNASTADGYNPYRITRDGIDWEVSSPPTPGRTSVIGAITRSFIS